MGIHQMVGGLFSLLVAGLASWLSMTVKISPLRWLGWLALAAVAIAGMTAGIGTLHAFLAPLVFSLLAVISLQLSTAWGRGLEPVADPRLPALASAAMAMPLLVVLQIALGAAYRHKVFGVMPHLAGAMVALLLILVVSVYILQNITTHATLRSAAGALLGVTLAQVSLGIAVFVMELLDVDNALVLVTTTAGHVAIGALTLAASTVMAIQLRRIPVSGAPV